LYACRVDATAPREQLRKDAKRNRQAIIDASADMELYDLAIDREPYRAGIYTLPELAVHAGSPRSMVERVQSVAGELIDDGKFVVTLGGEHSIAIGSALAQAERLPNLSILYLDAHADFRVSYLDTPFNHACALRRIVESGAGRCSRTSSTRTCSGFPPT